MHNSCFDKAKKTNELLCTIINKIKIYETCIPLEVH